MRLRKGRKKKKPGVKSVRVLPTQEPVHVGPRYNISYSEASKAYGRIRKGRGFIPVKKLYGKIDMLSFWDALISIGKVKMIRMLRWTIKSMI